MLGTAPSESHRQLPVTRNKGTPTRRKCLRGDSETSSGFLPLIRIPLRSPDLLGRIATVSIGTANRSLDGRSTPITGCRGQQALRKISAFLSFQGNRRAYADSSRLSDSADVIATGLATGRAAKQPPAGMASHLSAASDDQARATRDKESQ
jgi:hypothetical protein